MKWLLSIVGTGMSFIMAAAAETPAPAAKDDNAAGPRIQFEETRHNFGSIEPQVLKATFKFKNVGTQVLEIQKVQPGCGCTVIPDYDKKVEPGKEGVIHAQLNAAGYHGGHVEKGISVTTNDPKNRSVYLTLAADLKVDLAVLPQQSFFLTRLRPDAVEARKLEVHSSLPKPLVVQKVESTVPWLTASVVSSSTNAATIEVSTKPPLPPGNSHGQITVFTDYEKYKQVVIPANINVTPTISAIPNRLVFVNRAAETALLVTRNDGKQFHITSIEPNTPLLTASITTNEPGRSYRVAVKYKPGDAPKHNGNLDILTDEPTSPKVEIPYLFR